MQILRVTEILALGGAVDYSFCDEESKWQGSVTHKVTELLDQGFLDYTKVPDGTRGRLCAYERFKEELHFVPLPDGIEVELEDKQYGMRGRLDRRGLLAGVPAIIDLKSGAIQPAVDLQLAMYGHMADPNIWWTRVAVELRKDGTYRFRLRNRMTYKSDVATALAFARTVRWKIENDLIKA